MANYKVRGQLLYRGGFEVGLFLFIGTFIFIQIIRPYTGIGSIIKNIYVACPLILLCLINTIPLYYLFDGTKVRRSVLGIKLKEFDFADLKSVYYFRTSGGCMLIVEINGGPGLAECNTVWSFIKYFFGSKKYHRLFPLRYRESIPPDSIVYSKEPLPWPREPSVLEKSAVKYTQLREQFSDKYRDPLPVLKDIFQDNIKPQWTIFDYIRPSLKQ